MKSISKLLFKIKLDWYNESDAYSIGMKNAVTNDNGSLLKRRNGDISGCLFCPGDQPLLSRETIINLIDAFLADNKKIIRPAFQNTPSAPVLFPSWAFSELFSLPEGKGGGFVAKKYPERIQLVPVQDEYELKDVDTQKDLLILLNRFKYQLM